MNTYIIRNDFTGRYWNATAAEARLYAIGGMLDSAYTVIKNGGSPIGLLAVEISL